MEGELIAWWVIAGASLMGAVVLFRLLRMIRLGLVRWLGSAVALTLFCTPAPVPNYDGQWAPAFIVALFESLFQTDGQPGLSLRILGLSVTCVAILTVVAYYFLQRKLGSRADEVPAKSPPPNLL